MITLLVEPATFDHSSVRVEGEPYQHLFRARRVAVGEEMRIVDGRGRARWGKVERVDRTTATVALGEPAPDHEPAFRLELLVPTCRPERASWLVEKATELGVIAIRFTNMARAPRELGTMTFDRLRRVAVAAVEQCHRSRLPEITGPHAWSQAVGLAGPEVRWFLDTESTDDPELSVGAALRGRPGELSVEAALRGRPGEQGAHIGAPLHDAKSGALLVGPEGGLDPAERRELQLAGWRPAGLGDRTLRLETAAIVGAAFLVLGAHGS
ncbi:MAG TPA: RsmE family RNA methyltransferase [Thermoanaerobaculia bacterium]|nr:RsmE family RNA methyltransferase [Thermoanaerobaculia bacterium]